MGWFTDAIETVREPIQDAYKAVESAAVKMTPVVGEWASDGFQTFYAEVVATDGLTPEQAWVVFAATMVVGAGTGGGSLVAGTIARTAVKIAVKQAAKRAAIAGGLTAAIGVAAFWPLGTGGGNGPPDEPPGEEPREPVDPPPREVEVVIVPDGYMAGGGGVLSREVFTSWCESEFQRPGNLRVVLKVDDTDPHHLVTHARLALERENTRRRSTGIPSAKVTEVEE